jgi:hypothetical protein
VLAHTIEAISDGSIKRVQCNTCRGKHQYKSSEPGAKPLRSRLKSTASSKTKAKASDLERLMRGKDADQALPYNGKRRFVKGDLINHSVFGLGVVIEERDTQKIEVLFSSGSKILIHGRAG